MRARCASAGASQATMHRRYATVSLIAACVHGLTLPGDYASAASKIAGSVRTVSSVGCGDIEGVEEDTIVVEGTTATMVAADAVVYSAGDGADANFAGLLEAVEVDLALGRRAAARGHRKSWSWSRATRRRQKRRLIKCGRPPRNHPPWPMWIGTPS